MICRRDARDVGQLAICGEGCVVLLVASGLLGPSPPPGLGFLYTRTLVLGNDKNKEVASAFIEEVDAARLFGEIKLDESKSPRQWDWLKFERPNGG